MHKENLGTRLLQEYTCGSVELFTRPFLPFPFLTPSIQKSLGTKLVIIWAAVKANSEM